MTDAGGWIDFADFMHMALYTPGLGYYSAGSKKFGAGGDFVTAPEISSLFGQTLANQLAQVLQATQGNILELGAGTGKLARDILQALMQLDCLPDQYYILEVSDHLRQVQLEYLKEHVPDNLLQRVRWLNELPGNFNGAIIGNEVLDAIPVHLIHTSNQQLYERGVIKTEQGFDWLDKPLAKSHLLDAADKLALPDGYLTELNAAARGLISSLAHILQSGCMLMIDYGFASHEYYHHQRNQGTLMCHYQQLAHTNPLVYVGLQDITAHVDFTAIAESGIEAGLHLAGFCTQAQFLMNCGILDVMSEVSPYDMARYAPLAAAAQKLLSPAEMGDLFKVIAFTKNIEDPLLGFASGDKSHTL
jgi:SAM-dependent MidA family methyltransferase